jgi:hypothetical protein
LRYDFADQAQLEDWRPDGRGRSFVEWGSLRMGSANDLFLLKHRARFEAFTMNANVEFDGNGLCQGLGAQENRTTRSSSWPEPSTDKEELLVALRLLFQGADHEQHAA